MKNNSQQPNKTSFTQLEKIITLFIVLLSFVIRVIRLDVPHDWSFDEVYHALSAEAYALNDPRGYEWWNASPKDLAYEWLHPPIGKLLMAASIKIFAKPYIPESKAATVDGRTAFAWRFPGTVFAALTVWLLIVFGTKMFKNFWIGAVGGGLYGLDGLSFVQSRTGMNDIYVTFFVVWILYSLYMLISDYPEKKYRNLFWIGIASGLAASTKWSGFYAVGIAFCLGVIYVFKKRDWETIPTAVVCLGLLPPLIYILSYGQWWIQGHSLKQYYELHQQIWWYQTGLKATHGYQSQALTWPLLYRPVWFYVKYQDVAKLDGGKELYIGNIYTMGNPFIWWVGLLAIVFVLWQVLKGIWQRIEGKLPLANFTGLTVLLIGYFGMFLPWTFSPRIMFLYHYLPSVPFMCLMLAYGLWQIRKLNPIWKTATNIYLGLVMAVFIFYYPHWSALPLPESWIKYYFWLPSWK